MAFSVFPKLGVMDTKLGIIYNILGITDIISGNMTRLFINPTTGRKWNPRQAQYFTSKKDPNKAPVVKHEEQIQKMVCSYLKLQYPNVIFRSDTDSGRWEYSRQQLHNKVAMHSGDSWPDLFIYEPREVAFKDGTKQLFYGLALELKKDGTTIIVSRGERKGHLTSDPHIQKQFLMLKDLKTKGYYATFAVGFDEAQRIIDWYFGKSAIEQASIF